MNHIHKQQQQSRPINSSSRNQQKLEQKQTPIAFGSQPVSLKCPFCLQRIRTEIIMKPQLVSIMLALLLFTLVPNAIMIVVIVLVLQLTATKRHRCSLCQKQLGTDGKFLIIFTDRIYSYTIGQTGVLISKKILVTISLLVLTILLIFVRSTIVENQQYIQLTWQELKNKCPFQLISPSCNNDLPEKSVKNWTGYVMRIQDRRQSIRRFYDHAIQIYVKMQPAQRQSKIPDLYLFGSTSVVYDLSQVLDSLGNGDQIKFNATFQANNRIKDSALHNRYMHIISLQKTSRTSSNIELYMNKKEEDYYVKNYQAKGGLRSQKQQIIPIIQGGIPQPKPLPSQNVNNK